MKNSGIIVGVLIAVIIVVGVIWYMKSQTVPPTIKLTPRPGATSTGSGGNSNNNVTDKCAPGAICAGEGKGI